MEVEGSATVLKGCGTLVSEVFLEMISIITEVVLFSPQNHL